MILIIFALLSANLGLDKNPLVPGTPIISNETRSIVQASDKMTGDEILASLQILSDAGDESAEILIAEALFGVAFNIVRNEKRACDIFERLHLTYGEAAHNFATCFYRDDSGRTKDYVRARAEYSNAIALGWPDSKCALGNMLIAGQGGGKDVDGGLLLCLHAAEAGIAHAQTDYGTYFLMGEVVPKDAKVARNWLQKAADQEHANAAFLLAQIYQKGDGVTSDKRQAVELFSLAHKKGRPDAAYNIAMINLSWSFSKTDDKPQFDKSFLPEIKKWLEIATKQEPNPNRRRDAVKLLEEILQFQTNERS